MPELLSIKKAQVGNDLVNLPPNLKFEEKATTLFCPLKLSVFSEANNKSAQQILLAWVCTESC